MEMFSLVGYTIDSEGDYISVCAITESKLILIIKNGKLNNSIIFHTSTYSFICLTDLKEDGNNYIVSK